MALLDKENVLKLNLVTNNGMSVMAKNVEGAPPSELIMDSGAFSVTFETFKSILLASMIKG